MENHRFSRLQLLFGREALARLAAARVVIFGIGGVGSYAAEALVRGRLGHVTLVDFDEICLTNVNRQIHALNTTIGQPKVEAMAERCRQINPRAEIVAQNSFYQAETSTKLLEPGYDFVLDCIDHITAKLHLIQSCVERKIPIISSMGAANKIDPGLIRVADIGDTKKCRLARTMRKELRKRGINKGVPVVYSTEEFRPLSSETAVCAENCICPNKEDHRWRCTDRRVILGSSSYIPPIFGLTMAGEVMRRLSVGPVSAADPK